MEPVSIADFKAKLNRWRHLNAVDAHAILVGGQRGETPIDPAAAVETFPRRSLAPPSTSSSPRETQAGGDFFSPPLGSARPAPPATSSWHTSSSYAAPSPRAPLSPALHDPDVQALHPDTTTAQQQIDWEARTRGMLRVKRLEFRLEQEIATWKAKSAALDLQLHRNAVDNPTKPSEPPPPTSLPPAPSLPHFVPLPVLDGEEGELRTLRRRHRQEIAAINMRHAKETSQLHSIMSSHLIVHKSLRREEQAATRKCVALLVAEKYAAIVVLSSAARVARARRRLVAWARRRRAACRPPTPSS